MTIIITISHIIPVISLTLSYKIYRYSSISNHSPHCPGSGPLRRLLGRLSSWRVHWGPATQGSKPLWRCRFRASRRGWRGPRGWGSSGPWCQKKDGDVLKWQKTCLFGEMLERICGKIVANNYWTISGHAGENQKPVMMGKKQIYIIYIIYI